MLRNRILAQKMEIGRAEEEVFVERGAVDPFKRNLDNDLIKVVIGPRRSGKSFLVFQLLKQKRYGYVNFDDEVAARVKDKDDIIKTVHEVYGRDISTIFFDEIQNLEDWELFANRLKRQGYNLILSGSNAKLLSKELATHLTGRHLEIDLLTFSFPEYLKSKNVDVDKDLVELKTIQGQMLNLLSEYMINGGYPEVCVKGYEVKDYVKTLYENTIFKDVVRRYNLKYPSLLHDLGKYLVNNFSKETSLTKLRKVLGFKSVHTVERYLAYLIETYLLFTVDRFSFKFKEQLKSPRKIYCTDNSLITALGFNVSENYGRLMENLVAIELLRKKHQGDVEFFYYKSSEGHEVDFVLKEGLKIEQLVQVSYNVESYDVRKREMRALIKASRELKCSNLLVITWDYETEEEFSWFGTTRTIKFIPLWKWLLKI